MTPECIKWNLAKKKKITSNYLPQPKYIASSMLSQLEQFTKVTEDIPSECLIGNQDNSDKSVQVYHRMSLNCRILLNSPQKILYNHHHDKF